MKYFSLLALIFHGAVMADCGAIKCFNPCTQQTIELVGDKCSVSWNELFQCYEAYAECGNSQKCIGALCFDHCENRNHYFPKANSCKDIYDPAGMCWRSIGECL